MLLEAAREDPDNSFLEQVRPAAGEAEEGYLSKESHTQLWQWQQRCGLCDQM